MELEGKKELGMNPTTISFLSALAAAAWSMWTWQTERQKERDLTRNEMSAQYVNTFILSTQELQRKLYKILEEDELHRYRQMYANHSEPSPAAIDFLYHLSIFFGWELVTFRYGPYTRDSKMISITSRIGETMESRSRYSGDAFRFSLITRLGLATATVRPAGEQASKPTFVFIPFHKFEEDILNKQSERARLYRHPEVGCTLNAIDRALDGEPLEGRERLAALQNLLVDLVSYLEKQEGFRLFLGERRRASVQKPGADDQDEEIKILHEMPGRLRLRVPHLKANRECASIIQTLLESLTNVTGVRTNVHSASVLLEYKLDVRPDDFVPAVLAKLEAALKS
jgi:hypothetical protein